MAIGPRLELRQSQQLVMTPQLQLAIKLLTLTNIELETYIAEQLDQNPLLTAGAPEDGAAAIADAEPAPAPRQEPLNLVTASTELSMGGIAPGELPLPEPGQPGEGTDFDRFAGAEASLAETLLAQAGVSFSGERLVIAGHIIDHIDETGYLTLDIETIARRLGVLPPAVASVLDVLQRFDPSGVGARSLAECIAIQAREADRYDPAMAILIDNLDLVARGDIAALMRLCALDREDVMDMIRELRGYDPKPGLRYGSDPANSVVADVLVHQDGEGNWHVELNQATLPRLIIDRDYHATLARDGSKATNGFLSECLSDANWLMKALDQRARTIVKVAGEIVRHQQGFFESGVSALKPLTLRQVADAIEMHESTVSRVAANKYLSCDRGLFELRWFFASGVSAGDGEAASAIAVKDRIARLIAAEGAQVLSDDNLVDRLQAEGFDIARRTVAKYREALGLGSSIARRRARALAAA
ncbi:RNA polymerase factor sigma-54 [Polymorphobacter sp.]|uniref:RNA polymerase factor sigma-54 n=1 Tax=Polymorphobacter sp. TaxID=1909290 RepID=UPI003F7200F2